MAQAILRKDRCMEHRNDAVGDSGAQAPLANDRDAANNGNNDLVGWVNVIREQGARAREKRACFPELAKLDHMSGRWQESLRLIEWLSRQGLTKLSLDTEKVQELAARYLGLDIVKLRAEIAEQQQGD